MKLILNELLVAVQQNLPLSAITGKAEVCISISSPPTTPNVNMKGKGKPSEDEMRFTAY